MSNEVKRWWIDLRPHSNARAQGYSTRHSAWSRPIVRFGVNAVCVMPVEDHERIVAELRAEVERLKRANQVVPKDAELLALNGKFRDTIATQARVIEKLTEQRNRAADRHHKQSLNKYLERIAKFEAEIEAIVRGKALIRDALK